MTEILYPLILASTHAFVSLVLQCFVLMQLKKSSRLLDTGVLTGLLPYQQTLQSSCVLSVRPNGRLLQLIKKITVGTRHVIWRILWVYQILMTSIFALGGRQLTRFIQTKLKGILVSSDRHYREE